jgi:hypothetical protein
MRHRYNGHGQDTSTKDFNRTGRSGSGGVLRGVVSKSTLDEIVREGVRKMLQTAVELEVDDFLTQHADRRDNCGKRLAVRNGSLPSGELVTAAASLNLVHSQRFLDKSRRSEHRVHLAECPAAVPASQPDGRRVDPLPISQRHLDRGFLRGTGVLLGQAAHS